MDLLLAESSKRWKGARYPALTEGMSAINLKSP